MSQSFVSSKTPPHFIIYVQFANRRAIVGRSYKTAMLKVLYLAPKTCLTSVDEGAELLILNPDANAIFAELRSVNKANSFQFL